MGNSISQSRFELRPRLGPSITPEQTLVRQPLNYECVICLPTLIHFIPTSQPITRNQHQDQPLSLSVNHRQHSPTHSPLARWFTDSSHPSHVVGDPPTSLTHHTLSVNHRHHTRCCPLGRSPIPLTRSLTSPRHSSSHVGNPPTLSLPPHMSVVYRLLCPLNHNPPLHTSYKLITSHLTYLTLPLV